MGIFIDVGSRDETHENSGSLLALKNTYLKTLKHTNETINYGMIQMSGGECEMEYDEESIYYKANCFEYDVTDVFRMLGDMAFEPRSILAANVYYILIIFINYFRLPKINQEVSINLNII